VGREHGYITISDDGAVTAYRSVDPVAPVPLTGGGPGGSLPDWWTVDSTPGSESVDFGGAVSISPTDPDVDPLTIDDLFNVYAHGAVRIHPDDDTFGPALLVRPGLNPWANDDLLRLEMPTGEDLVKVGPTGAVTISPSAAVSGLTVKDSSAGTNLEANDTGLGFFGQTPAAQPTGVSVDAASIHAALVSLGLIAA
jgi:hypothetical protein